MSNAMRNQPDSSRLTLAILLAVTMHAGLACLPVSWRPVLPQPTVLRVSLAAPPPVIITQPPAPTEPPPTIAMPVSEPAAPMASAPPAAPVAPVAPIALAKPPPSPKAKPKNPSKPPKPKPIKPVTPPPIAVKTIKPAPIPIPKLKASKPVERPPVVAKVAENTPPAARNFERAPARRAEQTASAASASSKFSSKFGNDSKPGAAWGKAVDGHSSGTGTETASAPARSTRPATPPATGIRPLPGNPKPRYPPQVRQRGIEGRVVLRLTINAAGNVEAVSIAQSSGNELLDQEARLTVARWRFQPPGQSQAVAQVPISFRLQD